VLVGVLVVGMCVGGFVVAPSVGLLVGGVIGWEPLLGLDTVETELPFPPLGLYLPPLGF